MSGSDKAESGAEAGASFSTTGVDHGSATTGSHPGAKAVGALAFNFAGLKSTSLMATLNILFCFLSPIGPKNALKISAPSYLICPRTTANIICSIPIKK